MAKISKNQRRGTSASPRKEAKAAFDALAATWRCNVCKKPMLDNDKWDETYVTVSADGEEMIAGKTRMCWPCWKSWTAWAININTNLAKWRKARLAGLL